MGMARLIQEVTTLSDPMRPGKAGITSPSGTVRIIGGSLRSRRIRFESTAGLRPTPDRVRETLFSWLASRIQGAACLDLFAGSGALGFEAVSRGARCATLVESHPRTCSRLEENRRILQLDNVLVRRRDAFTFLRSTTRTFDIVFLDPPFGTNAIPALLELIAARGLLTDDAVVYLEQGIRDADTSPSDGWQILKQGRAGEVDFRLVSRQGNDAG
jgi:16S rRNA (guanine966-N2)-methyltransferase